jgi:large subunit ribosomal protein L3
MTSRFTAEGLSVPVTVIRLGPCIVVQKRSSSRDGYEGYQLGFEPVPERAVSRPVRGQFRTCGKGPFRVLKEFSVQEAEDFPVGTELGAARVFQAGERVNVQGVSKGRGFTGVVKRWGFGGFPGSHGTHEYFRHGGSIGNRSFPGRVFKGKRMAGQYGAKSVTTQSVEIVEIQPEENLVFIRGAIPGSNNGLICVSKAGRSRA